MTRDLPIPDGTADRLPDLLAPGVPAGAIAEHTGPDDRLRRVLAPHADDLAAAAAAAADPDRAAALATLAALAHGDPVPRTARQRLGDWLAE